MKLLRLSSLLALSLALILTACNGKSTKDLVANKWKLTEVSGEGAKDMSDAEKKEMTAALVMELTKDGKINISGLGGDPKMGTYKVSDDGKTLLFKRDGEEKEEPQQVNEITADKLVITDNKSKMVLTFSSK